MTTKLKTQKSKTGGKDEVLTKTENMAAASPDALPDDLGKLRSILVNDMTKTVQSALKSELEAALTPVNATLEQVKTYYESHEERIRGVEDHLSEYSDRLVSAETAITVLQDENAWLKKKLDDLENRSRRSNLRVVGIPEKLEGSDPVKFMTDFFLEVLGAEFFSRPLLLDRAHRVGAKPADGQPARPRVFLVRFHYYHDKHSVSMLRQELVFRGHRVFFHNDYSVEVGRKRAAFKDVKSLLYQKRIKFALLYPAQLQVTHEGRKHRFDTPEAAQKFYDLNWGQHDD